MTRIDRLLQILVVITVCLSGLLLGMGQNDFEPLVIAVLGAGSAFILVDLLNWFRLPQWIANLLAVLVTIVTVSNFYFTADSVRHLLGVGKLLVYLQTILLFQKKSARVYWQVLVLSLLQIVVGAVFNLGFEGGLLFILYMLFAGLTMMVLHLYQDRQVIRDRNRDHLSTLSPAPDNKPASPKPVVLFQPASLPRGVLRRMVGDFSVFGFGALVFALFLFYFLPRENSSWSGPREVPMQKTGLSKKVKLDHSQMILLSSRLEMNVRFWQPGGDKPFQPVGQPYLRGMALSNIQLDGNMTSWIAPPYQIHGSDFRPIDSRRNNSRFVLQEIVLEPTDDPLLYTVMPPRLTSDLDLDGYDWCWALGALTRQRSSDVITVTHHRYTLNVPVQPNGEFFESWPYTSRNGQLPLTPEQDPGNFKWLTWLEPERYPTIVDTGRTIAGQQTDGDHLRIAKRMEAYFQDEQRFSYTLDFRNVNRNSEIDSVEDFFANFQTGHCEYFASALALMLRSQGIPARVVVGFRGGDVNEFGGHLDVEARHAHAWVEAYIRPADCTTEMKRTFQANRTTGAWLRLDPTPAVDPDSDMLAGADDALGFAKSLWRDYILGLQADRRSSVISAGGFRLSGLFRVLDLDFWQSSISRISRNLKQPGGWKQYLVHIIVILFAIAGISIGLTLRKMKRRTTHAEGSGSTKRTGGFRRRIGKVLRSVSPLLGNWVLGKSADPEEVPFYSRMLKALSLAGFQRLPHQTQREFASKVALETSSIQSADPIGSLTNTITDFYYLVRFGAATLDEQQSSSVDSALAELEDCLKSSQSGTHH